MDKNKKKFVRPSTGEIVEAKNNFEAKKLASCGWVRVKKQKSYFIKGSCGNQFI